MIKFYYKNKIYQKEKKKKEKKKKVYNLGSSK